MVHLQFGVASFLALGGASKVPLRLQAPSTAAHRAALQHARESALRFVRRSYALRSGRRGPLLEEHWSRENVFIGYGRFPVDWYESGIRTVRMNEASVVPLRASRVPLPKASGQFDFAAYLRLDMRRTYEDPELLRDSDADAVVVRSNCDKYVEDDCEQSAREGSRKEPGRKIAAAKAALGAGDVQKKPNHPLV